MERRGPRVLIFGSRSWANPKKIGEELHLPPTAPEVVERVAVEQHVVDIILNGYYKRWGPKFTVIGGKAAGADTAGERWTKAFGVAARPLFVPFPADWYTHDREGVSLVPCRCPESKDFCKAAGFRRNQQMIDDGKPTVGFGFTHDIATSNGTRDMRDRMKRAGLHAYIIGGPQ